MVTSTISNSTASTGNNMVHHHPDTYNGMVLIQAFKKAKSSLQASFSAPHIKIFIIQPNSAILRGTNYYFAGISDICNKYLAYGLDSRLSDNIWL